MVKWINNYWKCLDGNDFYWEKNLHHAQNVKVSLTADGPSDKIQINLIGFNILYKSNGYVYVNLKEINKGKVLLQC